MGALVITHYQRILNYVTPDHVHVFVDGRIVASGGPELAQQLEAEGYEAFMPKERRWRHEHHRDRVVQGIRERVPVRLLELRRGGELLLQVGPRALARGRRGDRRAQERAGLDAQVPAQVARLLLARPLPDLGRQRRRDRLREHLLLHQADREAGREVGGPAGRHPRHLGQARHPGGGEEVPRRRRRPVRVRGRLPQAPGGPREEGRHLPRHGLGAPRARGHRQAVHRARSSRRTTTSSRR